MRISQLIPKLEEILKSRGDMNVYVDTEAGYFDAHYIPIDGVFPGFETAEVCKMATGEDEDDCILSLPYEAIHHTNGWSYIPEKEEDET